MSVVEPDRGTGRSARIEEVLRAFHEEDAHQTHDLRLLGWLWQFLAPYWRPIALSCGAGLVGVAVQLFQPLVVRYIIDTGAMQQSSAAITQGGLLLAGLLVLQQLAMFLQAFSLELAGTRAVADIRQKVFEFIHTLRLAYLDGTPAGRLLTRVTNDTDAIQELFSAGAFRAVIDLVQLMAIVAILLWMDWKLALFSFAVAPPTVVIVRLIRDRARRAFRGIRAKTARMNATMNEQLTGLNIVQAFGREHRVGVEFDEQNSAHRKAGTDAVRYESLQEGALDMVQSVCVASILIGVAFHPTSIGTLFAFNVYMMLFFAPVSSLAQHYTLLQRGLSGAECIAALLKCPDVEPSERTETRAPEVVGLPESRPAVATLGTSHPVVARECHAGVVAHGVAPALEFEAIDFSYTPPTPTLSDISFRIQAGQRVALVGPTGAGKTTVTALALRLYEPQAGVIRLFGRDVRSYSRHELRRRFAVVQQDVFLFPGTLASNIAIGEELDYARVEDVLRRLDALKVFARRAGGLDAPVAEQGANFSAGERQLIAFARAAYRNAEILILDEATASVDPETEAHLQHAMDASFENRTVIIVAHRLSTVRAADSILVFQKGQLVEHGQHNELLLARGLYSKLCKLHFAKQTAVAPLAR